MQQTLGALARQDHGQDTGFIQKNNNLLQKKTNEKKKQPNKNTIKTNITNYKTKTDWYASLLMYNSY